MLTESFGRSTTENHSGRDKQVPAVKDCRFTQTAFGTVVHDSRGKWLGQYETDDAAVKKVLQRSLALVSQLSKSMIMENVH